MTMTIVEPTVEQTAVEHELQIYNGTPRSVTIDCTCGTWGMRTLVADPPSLSNELLTRAVLTHAEHVRSV